MLAIHSGAVAALLPRFWSPQGFLALLILYLGIVLSVSLGLHRRAAHRGLWWSHSEWMLHEIPALREIHRFTGDMQAPSFLSLARWLVSAPAAGDQPLL